MPDSNNSYLAFQDVLGPSPQLTNWSPAGGGGIVSPSSWRATLVYFVELPDTTTSSLFHLLCGVLLGARNGDEGVPKPVTNSP
ncbi:unnamed protein product [Arctogadus glacialis]